MYMSKILWFQECTFQNSNLVGGKKFLFRRVTCISQINSADGFAITTEFYDDLLRNNSINLFIESFYTETVTDLLSLDLNKLSEILKSKIKECKFTKDQEDLLKKFYREMPTPVELAVRSSAIAEDLPNASFAGQQDTYLNIRSFEQLKDAVLRCFASLFNSNAISYRMSNNISYSQVKMAISVQQMIRSDLGSAGVAFSLDTESGYSKAIVINSSFGLGESVVGGLVTPDEFIVDKRVLEIEDSDPIITKELGRKNTKVVFTPEGGVEETRTNEEELARLSPMHK